MQMLSHRHWWHYDQLLQQAWQLRVKHSCCNCHQLVTGLLGGKVVTGAAVGQQKQQQQQHQEGLLQAYCQVGVCPQTSPVCLPQQQHLSLPWKTTDSPLLLLLHPVLVLLLLAAQTVPNHPAAAAAADAVQTHCSDQACVPGPTRPLWYHLVASPCCCWTLALLLVLLVYWYHPAASPAPALAVVCPSGSQNAKQALLLLLLLLLGPQPELPIGTLPHPSTCLLLPLLLLQHPCTSHPSSAYLLLQHAYPSHACVPAGVLPCSTDLPPTFLPCHPCL
jgi:hypothetical protein